MIFRLSRGRMIGFLALGQGMGEELNRRNEGTIKTPIPKCPVFTGVFVWGGIVYVYIYIWKGGKGGGGQREGGGATVHKRGRIYQHGRLYLQ